MAWKHAKPVIGLMGAPASGKSFVARQFAEAGAAIIDADQLARDATRRPDLIAAAKGRWGETVIADNGQLDRRAVASRVFDDDADLRWWESLIHPRVAEARQGLHAAAFADPDIVAVVEDCPLLLETGLDADCDVLVFADAPWDLRLERANRTRGWDFDELRRREERQASLDTKLAAADHVVSTAAEPDAVTRSVTALLSQILSGNPHHNS